MVDPTHDPVSACSCCTCGYAWVRGEDGRHSCATILSHQLEALRWELRRAALRCQRERDKTTTPNTVRVEWSRMERRLQRLARIGA